MGDLGRQSAQASGSCVDLTGHDAGLQSYEHPLDGEGSNTGIRSSGKDKNEGENRNNNKREKH